ncbi:ArsR family transcriptional regulator [Natronolimnobius sp. AArcel1]|uniref:helix-turn-helix transcriptional regulator n=1 Tax=Natronolimnobius sp. AArcel1 TaxID=1679093 RepID=UPI0013ED7846|nr:ArsR family transcriptional regulator [Natronolimnobius sp. AArcel1]NGM67972.1 ArsR family transcriptional regulator [Natronolimnobius sp. AArcel1]
MEPSEASLEEIEFLSLSPNRVAVLGLLAEESHTRTELAGETGASQATLGRILSDFADRSWITRAGSEYRATATGCLVAAGFDDLQTILETERKLRTIVEYLPSEEFEFDIRRLSDATITLPTQTRPNAPLQRLLSLLREGERVRAVSHAFNEQTLTVVRERTGADVQTFEGVFSQDAIDALEADPSLRSPFRTLLENERATVRTRQEGVPIAAMVIDETAYLLLRDDHGVLRAAVDTDDDAVRSWAHERFEAYWADATPLEAGDLSSSTPE